MTANGCGAVFRGRQKYSGIRWLMTVTLSCDYTETSDLHTLKSNFMVCEFYLS